MTTLIGTGISSRLDSFIAGKEAAKKAYLQLGKNSPNIVIVFISTIYDQKEAIKGIRSITNQMIPLVGSSTAASITSAGSLRHSVTVNAISSDCIKFSYGLGNNLSKNPRSAGNRATRQASSLKDIKRQACIMFFDGLSVNAAELLRGAQETLGLVFPIIGGAATDNLHFKKTYQYLNDDIYTNSVVSLIISGEVNISMGSAQAWQPIGRPHRITKANSNIIREIDRKNALGFYEEYVNKSSDELKKEGIARLGFSYPLGAQDKEQKGYFTRSPLNIENNNSLRLTAEIPEEKQVSLMISDKNLILDATKKACNEALKNTKKSMIKFVVVFSDVGRLLLLRKDLQAEAEIIKDVFGKKIPFFGCYTGGEYAPIYTGTQEYKGRSYYHNQTISVAVFSEKN